MRLAKQVEVDVTLFSAATTKQGLYLAIIGNTPEGCRKARKFMQATIFYMQLVLAPNARLSDTNRRYYTRLYTAS